MSPLSMGCNQGPGVDAVLFQCHALHELCVPKFCLFNYPKLSSSCPVSPALIAMLVRISGLEFVSVDPV